MLKKILIIVFAFICGVTTFEIFLRYSPFEYGLSPVFYDSQIGMWHKKNFSDYKISECYKTKYIFDENGLPKNSYDYDNSKYDVVLLGDSYIEALMVKNQNIIHNALAREYSQNYNFLNYGLSGSSPTQQFVILKEKVNISHTKYITQFIFLENDLMDVGSNNLTSLNRPKVQVEFFSFEQYKIIPPRGQKIYDKLSDFFGNFQLYAYVKKVIYYLKDNFFKESNSITREDNKKASIKQIDLTKNWLYLKGAIFQINRLAHENNIKYQVIVISENKTNLEIIKDFFKQYDINYLILNEQKELPLQSFECDKHWDDTTHINIAKYLKSIDWYQE